MPNERNYTFYVKPLCDACNEQIAHLLNAQNLSAEAAATALIKVNGRDVSGVYIVPHRIITQLLHSDQWKHKVTAYVKEGEGEIRKYNLFYREREAVRHSKPVKAAARQLASR